MGRPGRECHASSEARIGERGEGEVMISQATGVLLRGPLPPLGR